MLTVDAVSALRHQLWDAGFRPLAIKNLDKAPLGREWQIRARQDPPESVRFDAVAHALNTGILCDGLRAIDIDVDDQTVARRCRAVVLLRCGDTVIRVRHNSPRCLLLYRASEGEPEKIVLAGKFGKVEVLGKGQQFVAFGKHPSGADLEWSPEPPGAALLNSIPALAEAEIYALLNELAPIIEAEAIQPATNGHDHTAGDPQAEPLRIASALHVIPNSGPADWEAWNRVCMAIWAATGGSAAGWEMLAAWSARNPAYDPMEARGRWNHYFTSPPTRIGAGTIFYMAKQAQSGQAARPEPSPAGGYPLPLVFYQDVMPNLDAADFVEGLLIEGSMAVVYGESNCGKTFFMTDLGLHVAMGKPWRGRDIEHGGVIYCALEGSHGISNRIAAFRAHHKPAERLPFAIIPSAINMLDPAADTDLLIETIHIAASELGVPVRLVVIDTLSRAMAGGNENAPDDMGSLVSNTDKVRQATRAAVAFVHHSGKDTAKGARGHSLLRAATDTEIEILQLDKDSPAVATVTKQRELEIEGQFPFTLQVIELGNNRRGKPVTSCVVIETEIIGTETGQLGQSRVPPNGAIGLRALKIAMSQNSAKLPPTSEYPENTWGTSVSQWKEEFYQLKSGSPDAQKHAFSRAEDALLARDIITVRNGLVWFCKYRDNQFRNDRDKRDK
jgi:hypothetical protein